MAVLRNKKGFTRKRDWVQLKMDARIKVRKSKVVDAVSQV
jgi:hypothetical protein